MDDLADLAPLSNRVLGDRYELGELLGVGGWAMVYSAYDRRLTRRVAVKVLRPELAVDDSIRARFRREAQSAAGLNHPSIVSVHDSSDDGPHPFIVMEYVPGPTLRETMPDGRPMPVGQALAIIGGVLDALGYAHQMGIVHRDIKPSNIIITPQGVVKVMDFGIARAMNVDRTITMTVVGTPAYLSPEHADGLLVDTRSDLYSTGCVLFEMLTGRLPFISESPFVMARQHVQDPAPVPSTLNPALPAVLDQVVAKAMAKDRDVRYQTAAEFRKDLAVTRTADLAGHHRPLPVRGRTHADVEPTQVVTRPVPPPAPSTAPSAAPAPSTAPYGAPAIATGPPPTPPLGAPPAPPPAPPGTDRTRRRWVAIAAGLAAGLLVVGGVVLAALGRDADKPRSTHAPTEASQGDTETPGDTGNETPQTAASVCAVGEWKVDNYSVSKAFTDANPRSSGNTTSGTYRIVLDDDGTASSDWKMTVRVSGNSSETTALDADMTATGHWSGTDDNLVLVFTAGQGTLTADGQARDISGETWTGSCSGSKLTITGSGSAVFGTSTLTLTRLHQ